MPDFFEFFAGGGMARLGLGEEWRCSFANDICKKKVSTYVANFGDDEILQEDIHNLDSSHLPGKADLIWGSFPCQDLSLAGNGAGLNGKRSGTFNKLVSIVEELKNEKRAPNIIVLENVVGAITSHSGKDFEAIITSLSKLGYYYGCLVIDGAYFVPQSRPRLFVIATKIPKTRFINLTTIEPDSVWHPNNLIKAHAELPEELKNKWVWWSMPSPPKRDKDLINIVEKNPTDVKELDPLEVNRLISMMSDTNIEKLNSARKADRLMVGSLYKRVRKQKSGEKIQRAEIRFDGTAGCLRTPTGGSSRQTLIIVENETVKARLLSRREAARLMGVPDGYELPERYNDAYHVFGDGLVVPVVSWIEQHVLKPLQKTP